MTEILFRPEYEDIELTHGLYTTAFIGSVAVIEPDFETEGFDPDADSLCEYCGKGKGYPTNLGIHVALLCDQCATFCEDEIVYDISQI